MPQAHQRHSHLHQQTQQSQTPLLPGTVRQVCQSRRPHQKQLPHHRRRLAGQSLMLARPAGQMPALTLQPLPPHQRAMQVAQRRMPDPDQSLPTAQKQRTARSQKAGRNPRAVQTLRVVQTLPLTKGTLPEQTHQLVRTASQRQPQMPARCWHHSAAAQMVWDCQSWRQKHCCWLHRCCLPQACQTPLQATQQHQTLSSRQGCQRQTAAQTLLLCCCWSRTHRWWQQAERVC